MTKQELLDAAQERYPELLIEIEAFMDIAGAQDSTWIGTKELYLITRNGGQYRLHLDKQQPKVQQPQVQKMKKYPKIQHSPKNLLDRNSM